MTGGDGDAYADAVNAARDDHAGLVVAGYVMLFLFPPGAVVAGIALDKTRPGHAIALSMLGLAVILLWALTVVFLTA